MCGIAGFYGRFGEDLLARMSDAIAHRGPDDDGVYMDRENGVGIAHRRLSIIDPTPSGHQPMWDARRRAVIVFNGEIYNYQSLREELERDGFVFSGASDTEVVVNMYVKYGADALPRLNGIFAFAVWSPGDRSLFLARDGVGVKPLYYSQTGRGFLFASELKALLREPSIDREINPAAVMRHLGYLWSPAPETMLKSVKKLEPGHAMIVRDGRVERETCFYDLPAGDRIERIPAAEAAAKVRGAVAEAVRRQMVADVPVGAFLSGGLDSSAVAAFARDHAGAGRLQCFTIGFKGAGGRWEGMAEDLPYARRAAKSLGVDLHVIEVGPEMAGELEKMIYHLDEPQADPAPINVMFISRLAREHGVKVLLSGAGGDDIFTGYRRHFALAQERLWAWAPKLARKGLAVLARKVPAGGALGRRVSRAFRHADLDGDRRLASYFLWTDPETVAGLLGQRIRDELADRDLLEPLMKKLDALPRGAPPVNRMLYLEGKFFLPDHNLNYTDKMSMAEGVEVRVPLLDPDLVELAASLPVEQKQRGREGKWIFKKAMEPILPGEIIHRPKTGFGAPVRSWLRNELREMVDDTLSAATIRERGLFNAKGVRRLVESDREGRIDAAYTILSLVSIELWMRIFMDGRAAA